MLRRLNFQSHPVLLGVRMVSSYNERQLSHAELCRRYPPVGSVSPSAATFAENSLLPSLEAVEERVATWKLSRWELRVPALATGVQKEHAMQQIFQIRKHMEEQIEIIQNMNADKDVLVRTLGIRSTSELVGKDRSWLQSKVDALRWEGRVSESKAARDAWMRLEQYGARDFRLLERICAVYAMARMNTFADAFSNFIVEDQVSKSLMLEVSNPFEEAVSLIVGSLPTIDICYEFLGWNGGYVGALKRYMRHVLVSSRVSGSAAQSLSGVGGRVLYSSASEVLFDLSRVDAGDSADEACHSVGDLLFYSEGKASLISVASTNRHDRSLQIPSRRQLEGISRRLCLSLGIAVEDVKVQFVFLPPSALDAASLHRLHRVMGLTDPVGVLAEQGSIPVWASLYDRVLPVSESDYVEIQRKFPEEEWVLL